MITEQWQALQQHINQVLVNYLGQREDRLTLAMRHSVNAGGKRLRPILLYLTGFALGAERAALDSSAAAIEFIHTYSLIHDDLPAMDDDDLRRGQPTCHIAFDEATAILAGDALQTLAFEVIVNDEILSATQQVNVIRALAHAAGKQGMVYGQTLDIAATGKPITVDALQHIHAHKTGALIHAAVSMATYVADCDLQTRQRLAQFAQALGVAFQIQDDILDVTSSSDILGKPQGTDARSQKLTYASLMPLSDAQQLARHYFQQAENYLHDMPYDMTQLLALCQWIAARDH